MKGTKVYVVMVRNIWTSPYDTKCVEAYTDNDMALEACNRYTDTNGDVLYYVEDVVIANQAIVGQLVKTLEGGLSENLRLL